jgi:hypothetical protein
MNGSTTGETDSVQIMKPVSEKGNALKISLGSSFAMRLFHLLLFCE